jgi:hypothetical protein
LIPRRSPEEREKRWMQEIYRKIQDYIKNGCEDDLNLNDTPIKILPDNLKHVGGRLKLARSKIEDLNSLEYVGIRLDLRYTPIKKLPDNLKRIPEDLWLDDSKIEDLNNLEYVGGYLDAEKTLIKRLPNNLKRIDGTLNLMDTLIEDLNNLEYVGGHLYLKNTPLSKTRTVEEIRSKININGVILYD